MSNPYMKWMSKEDILQHQVITWLRLQHPTLKYHHSPDSGKRTPFEQFKYKYLGADAGFPDLMFPSLQLVIELKIKPNTPTVPQKGWLEHFASLGWQTGVCYSFEQATDLITFAVQQNKAA